MLPLNIVPQRILQPRDCHRSEEPTSTNGEMHPHLGGVELEGGFRFRSLQNKGSFSFRSCKSGAQHVASSCLFLLFCRAFLRCLEMKEWLSLLPRYRTCQQPRCALKVS